MGNQITVDEDEYNQLKKDVSRLKEELKKSNRQSIIDGGEDAIPLLSMFEEAKKLENVFSSISSTIVDLRFASMEASKEIGGGLRFYKEVNQQIAEASVGLAGIGVSITEIGGYQKEFTGEIGTNMLLTAKAFENIGVLEKLGADGVKMAVSFKDAAQSVSTMLDELEVVGDAAANFGVNTKVIFEAISETMKTTDQYRFENGVEGMSRMAAKAAVMGVEFRSLVGFADKIMNPEGAIDAVANFQRLGVAVGDLADPFKLMYMAQSDMEGLTDAVTKSVANMATFNKETGKMEIPAATRMQMKEMGDQLGLSREEMNNMVSAQAKLAAMDDIGGFKFDASEEDKLLLAGLSEFNKETKEFEVKVDGKTKAVSELSEGDLEILKQRPKTLEEAAQQQLSSTEKIRADVETIRKALTTPIASSKAVMDLEEVSREPLKVAADDVRKAVKSSEIKSVLDDIAISFRDEAMNAIKSDGDAEKILNDLSSNFFLASGEKLLGMVEKFTISIGESTINYTNEVNKRINDDNAIKPIVSKISSMVTGYFTNVVEQLNTNFDLDLPRPNIAQTPGDVTIPVRDFIIKSLPEDTVKVVGGTNMNQEQDITKIINNQNNNTQALTSIIQPKTESINSSVLNQNVTNIPNIQPQPTREIRETQTREVVNEAQGSKEFNVRFDPIVIRLEGEGRNVEMALEDNKIRSKIIDMVGDAMSYSYGGKSRL